MLKKTITISFIILLLFLLIKSTVLNQQQTNQAVSVKGDKSFTKGTEIIDYRQTYIPEEKRSGSCWTSSIAASSNKNAYRCDEGDPCFSDDNGRVVCGVDPEKPGSGFELQLTKDLPPNDNLSESENSLPWLTKLVNGGYCRVYTGTAFMDKTGKFYYLYCYDNNNNHIGDGDLDKSGNLWKVNLIQAKSEQDEFKTETVDVVKVWK